MVTMKRQWILLISPSLQMALFALLAWWVTRHPQSLKEVMFTRIMQRKQTTPKRRFVKVFSTATGSAMVLNLLVVRWPLSQIKRVWSA